MTTISKEAKLVTFINVFTVEPANQERLLKLLALVTATSVRHAPGFISSALHRSLDGTKVTMYGAVAGDRGLRGDAQGPDAPPVLAGCALHGEVRARCLRGRRFVPAE